MTFPSRMPGDPVSTWQNIAQNEGDPHCTSCKRISYTVNSLRVESLKLTNDNEVLRDRVAELEAQVSTATGATADARQAEFIKRLSEIDRTQRTSIAWQQRDIADLISERDDLRRLLDKHDVDPRGIREHTVTGLVTVTWSLEREAES